METTRFDVLRAHLAGLIEAGQDSEPQKAKNMIRTLDKITEYVIEMTKESKEKDTAIEHFKKRLSDARQRIGTMLSKDDIIDIISSEYSETMLVCMAEYFRITRADIEAYNKRRGMDIDSGYYPEEYE